MKTWIAAAVLAALCLSVAPEASAQVVVNRSWTTGAAVGGPAYSSSGSAYSSQYVPYYSYYAAWPLPARGYVAYGPTDIFPFYGEPYGHPYDRWTWPYMSGGYSRYLARYYYPPLQ